MVKAFLESVQFKIGTPSARKFFVTLLWLAAAISWDSSAIAEEISWLKEVTTAPSQIPAPTRPLRPVLQKSDGTPIQTLDDWRIARAELKQAWSDFLGPLPTRPDSFELKSLQVDSLETTTRELIEYQVEEGRRVQAYLLRPKEISKTKRPALVVFHGTNPETSKSEVGLGNATSRNTGLKLAEQGFVVICPANFLWEESSFLESVAAAKNRHPDSLGMATMLADGMRAVDLLLTCSDVDPQRIGAIGHSLGAKETLYLMAFDDRVQAGVASEGGLGLDSTNWEAPWYLGPAIKNPDFPRNHQELVALIAPRPFLVFGGESGPGCADGERSWPYVTAGQEVSKLYETPVRQGFLNHHEGHLFSPASHKRAIEWLERYVTRKERDPGL